VKLEDELVQQSRLLDLARQEQESRTLVLLVVLTGIILLLAMLFWILRLVDSNRMTVMREQIACDIHDEIGANLSAIAHLYELLERTISEPSKLQGELLTESKKSIRATANEARLIVDLLEGRIPRTPVISQMLSSAEQILKGIEFSFKVDPELNLQQLRPMRKWHLLLFFKEALNNIYKHSGASQVEINLQKSEDQFILSVKDDGAGIAKKQFPLRHLESRADRLKGKMSVTTAENEGTTIELKFHLPKS